MYNTAIQVLLIPKIKKKLSKICQNKTLLKYINVVSVEEYADG